MDSMLMVVASIAGSALVGFVVGSVIGFGRGCLSAYMIISQKYDINYMFWFIFK